MNPFSVLKPALRKLAAKNESRKRVLPLRPSLEVLEDRTVPSGFEVWTVDQSNTRDNNADGALDSGGTLYIYRGNELEGHNAAAAAPEVIDLGGDVYHDFMVEATAEAGVRPHMLLFNSTGSHAILSFVASGHVLFLDAATRQPVGVVDVDPQAHAAFPAPDDSYVIVANQNGKMLHRIFTDYAANTFTLDSAALDLAALELPGRPDNRPICPIVTSDSRFTFVTLAGGGMLVLHTERSAPMTVVADYTSAMVHRDGCGGVEVNGKMYVNAGGPGHSDLYVFNLSDFDSAPNPQNSPAPTLVYSQDGDPATPEGHVDAHGAALTKHGRYLWIADRWANKIVVVDTSSDEVVNEMLLAGGASADPTPDLMDISPSGNRVFMALRGPSPLTANNPAFNNAVGATPGVGVIQVMENGRTGKFIAVAPISHIVGGVERADPHALRVRIVGADTTPTAIAAAESRENREDTGRISDRLEPGPQDRGMASEDVVTAFFGLYGDGKRECILSKRRTREEG
jgi:DNA-binding beta-propeller fold protein YncE